ncbi:MAG: arsenate reductase [Bacteroidetes bacterium]|nr:MAG: arsenate reductase [Bacteroidota bacterium]
MRKIYYLSTCKTCQRILQELGGLEGFEKQDLKTEPLNEAQLEELHRLAGSYEALFSRRSQKFREWGLKDKPLGEADYRDLLLKHYSFLKRPVIVVDGEIFIGSAKKEVEGARAKIQGHA